MCSCISQIIVQRRQIAASRWPNDISFAADNALKNRALNIECSFGCAARSAVLLKPNLANMLLFNFCEQKCVQHSSITIALDCNDLSLLIFENLRQTVTGIGYVGFSMYACGLSVAQSATILLVYIPAKIKMNFIWKDDFFAKIGIFCSSVRRKDKSNYLSN